MTSALVESPLAGLAREINAAHAMIEGAVRSSLEQARRCGELLLQAKGALPHGQWLPWLAAHVPFSHQTASVYMRIAGHQEKLLAVSNLPLVEAAQAVTREAKFAKADVIEWSGAVDGPPDEEGGPPAPSAVPLDPLGLPLPDRSLPAFAGLEAWREAARQAEALARLVGGLEKEPGGEYLAGDGSAAAQALCAALDRSAPHAGSCPACYRPGEPPDPDCPHCGGLGWLSRHIWHSCPPDLRARHVRRLAARD